MKRAILLAGVVAMMGCASLTSSPQQQRDADLKQLADWLTGSFSSEEQSKADPEFRDIRLHMSRIWTDRKDGYWLYVEQAAATALDRPYRQRVCNVVAVKDGEFRSIAFELPGDPLRFAGASDDPSKLNGLDPQQLSLRSGCDIVLHKTRAGAFEGGTVGAGCPSTLQGASYATSEVKLTADTLVSWDRGFDSAGQQVWGARKGGYIFKRVATTTQP